MPGERRPGREAEGTHFKIRPARGGIEPIACSTPAKRWGFLFNGQKLDPTVFQNLEKVFKHRDLKEKLLETKVTQANMILKEAEEKHRLEKDLVE